MHFRTPGYRTNLLAPRSCGFLLVCICLASTALAGGRSGGNLLIVSASDYVDSTPLNQYVTARENHGFNVEVYSVPSGTNRTAIRNYILTLWGTSEEPDYILIVGDTDGSTSASDSIPYWSGGGSKGSPTDLPYACDNSGIEWYPDASVGRWSCRNTTQLQNIVSKSLFVEAGNYPDPDYYKRSAFLANPSTQGMSDPSHDWVIENLLEPAGHQGIKIYGSQGGDTQDVTDAINNGVLFTVYYGHSSSSGWWDPSFYSSNINSLSNTGMYGLACGWSCQTAMFTTGECFGETWIRAANKGAAAYISASDYIYWGSVSAWQPSTDLEAGFFRAMYEDDIWEVGPAWQAGLFHFLETYGEWDGNLLHEPSANQDVCRNFFEEFVILGDPSLLLPGASGFEISCDPAFQSLCSPPADEAVYTVDVQAVGNFEETITLSVLGAPPGTTVDFSNNDDVAPFTSMLTVGNLAATTPGAYNIKISGISESKDFAFFAKLHISDGAPGSVALISPPNGGDDAPLDPTLSWAPAAQGVEYDLEVAEDADFNDVVYAASTMETSHTIETELERATQYYWRVRAVNACDAGVFSTVYNFMTYTDADYFTEQFNGDFDLDNFSVSFIPDGTGDHYAVCGQAITELPTVPEGGMTIHLPEDSFGQLELTVFGEGNPHAKIMLIGEGPGRDEDALGRPFVGRAGQLLDKMLHAIALSRNDVFIGNILKCRPPGNRDPLPHEAVACIGYLRAQVSIIKPKILVCLGRISAGYILGQEVRITRDRGIWHDVKGFHIMPTYHPAALLRNEPLKKDAYSDLLAIRAKYDEICEAENEKA